MPWRLLMEVGDLVKVIYEGSLGLVVRIDDECLFSQDTWVYLHTGESFKADKLEIVNGSR